MAPRGHLRFRRAIHRRTLGGRNHSHNRAHRYRRESVRAAMFTVLLVHFANLDVEARRFYLSRFYSSAARRATGDKSERVEQRNDNGRHDCRLSENGGNLNPRNTYEVFGSHRFSAASWVLDLHISRSRCNRSARRASAVRNTSGDDTVCTSHHRVSWQAR